MRFWVHCNIRKKTLSVKALEGDFKGLIVASAERAQLEDAEFRVSEAGRQRVLKSGHKNVHAGVVGTLTALWGAVVREDLDQKTRAQLGIGKFRAFRPIQGESAAVRYNPKQTSSFVRVVTGEKVTAANLVQLDRCSILAI